MSCCVLCEAMRVGLIREAMRVLLCLVVSCREADRALSIRTAKGT